MPSNRWITTLLIQEWDGEKYVTVHEEGYWYDGPVALAHDGVQLVQQAFRWYDDSATAVSAQDTDPTTLSVDTAYQFCVRISNTSGDTNANNTAFRIEYQHVEGGNAWTQVGVSDGTGTPVNTATAGLTDGNTYGTDRLTGAAETRDNGYEETSSDRPTFTLNQGVYQELIYGIQIDSAAVANNDTIHIRITDAGSVLNTYSVNPSITISEAADNPENPGTGTLVLTGQAPTRLVNHIQGPAQDPLILTGLAPSRVVAEFVSPAQGTLALSGQVPLRPAKYNLTGYAPSVGIGVTVGKGSLTLTGTVSTVGQSITINVPTGTLALTGQAPTVTYDWVIVPTQGTVVLSGELPTATATANHIRAPPVGSLTLTGQVPTTGDFLTENPGVGSVTLTGLAPTRLLNHIQAPAQGTLALSGLAPTVSYDWVIPVAVGSLTLDGKQPQRPSKYNLTGYVPTVSYDWVVQPGVGTFTLAGLSPAVSAGDNVVEQPGTGTLALAGLIPTVTFDWVVGPNSGSLILTGSVPTVQAGASVTEQPGVGALTLTGNLPTVGFDWVIPVGVGSLTLAGSAPTVDQSGPRLAQPGVGSLLVIGLQPLRPRKPFKLTGYKPTVELESVGIRLPDKGTLALTGQAPVVSRFIDVSSGALALTGLAPNSGDQLSVSAGSLALSGKVPQLTLSRTTVGKGSAVITGHSPATTIYIDGADASLQLAGYVPTFSFATVITKTPGKGSRTLTGQVPTIVLEDHVISPATGTLNLTGSSPSLASGVSVGKGSLILNGKAVTFTFGFGWNVSVGVKALALTGQVPKIGRLANPDAGTLALNASPPAIGRDWVVRPGGDSSYQDATFTYSSATAAKSYEEFVGRPTLRLSGKPLTVIEGVSIVVGVGQGSLALTGIISTVISHQAAPGQLNLTGYTPTLTFSRVNVGKGSLGVNGKVPSLVVPKTWKRGPKKAGAWTLDSDLTDGWVKDPKTDKSWT